MSQETPTPVVATVTIDDLNFDEDLIRKYPRSNKKISINVAQYGLSSDDELKGQTQFISPYGIQFQATRDFEEGTLLKILVTIPDYWNRKQRLVDYQRIDTPATFRVLAKVVRTEDVGKRGKKKVVIAQTVNIDGIDESILKNYLQDG